MAALIAGPYLYSASKGKPSDKSVGGVWSFLAGTRKGSLYSDLEKWNPLHSNSPDSITASAKKWYHAAGGGGGSPIHVNNMNVSVSGARNPESVVNDMPKAINAKTRHYQLQQQRRMPKSPNHPQPPGK